MCNHAKDLKQDSCFTLECLNIFELFLYVVTLKMILLSTLCMKIGNWYEKESLYPCFQHFKVFFSCNSHIHWAETHHFLFIINNFVMGPSGSLGVKASWQQTAKNLVQSRFGNPCYMSFISFFPLNVSAPPPKKKAFFLTRSTLGTSRPDRRVILTCCFFSSQLSTCFSLVMRSWDAMSHEKVSSFTCTGAVEKKDSWSRSRWHVTHYTYYMYDV